MRRSPGRGLLIALVATAVAVPVPTGQASGSEPIRAFSTVGRLVARRVEGRTVVIVPIAGPVQVKLSEPFKVKNHWRLYLTVTDARISIGRSATARRPEGVLALTAEEVSGDVRVTIDVPKLGSYGSRRSEEGVLVWIDDEAPPPPTPEEIEAASAGAEGGQAQLQEQGAEEQGGGWIRTVVLLLLAAGVGVAVRYVRRNGVPDWARDAIEEAVPRLKVLLFRRNESSNRPTALQRNGHVPNIDPRGRSAEIDDAFRVEPEKPASGIAALAATDDGIDE